MKYEHWGRVLLQGAALIFLGALIILTLGLDNVHTP